ncbi:MAG: hypothetical protein G3M78_14025 [Candidatus Nitrohelix vancouverensis]|uniref:Uncharacterized protein n=1 Tax=Candidatus Nitrohelix vancouverensis TaxID=2705534 RepID=A0A7T0G4J2_9BACT|nr:MAG: hypothetical protein G3M78_14025 [Candidatus Nitrohelix vancouverensis]
MSTLKGMLFSQYANEGLSELIETLQKKHKPKKGRRFNLDNITYEISRSTLKDNQIEFAISSKIPQDELKDRDGMDAYFQNIETLINKEKSKPILIEMENIVWGAKKDADKNRDYVKLVYQYQLDQLFDNQAVPQHFEAAKSNDSLKNINGAFTPQGKVVLKMVRDKIQEIAQGHMDTLINANNKVKAALKN